jgi:hypothetical protein
MLSLETVLLNFAKPQLPILNPFLHVIAGMIFVSLELYIYITTKDGMGPSVKMLTKIIASIIRLIATFAKC